MNIWQQFLQSQLRRKSRNQDKKEEQGFKQQWFLLSGKAQDIESTSPDFSQLNAIYPPDDYFWADPFVWKRDGRQYIFFENYPYQTRTGHISVIEVDDNGRPISAAQDVLKEGYHLSYPFLFEHDDELYMVPEKTQAKRVDLYRCTRFPDQWTFVHTLIDNIKMADATIFEHEGKWWLFGAAKKGRVRINESLFAFYADSPLSQHWTPHPHNPLVKDFSRGRSAGRVFRGRDGVLRRPSQDCVRRYGYGLYMNRISQLSPIDYREQAVWHIVGPEIQADWRASHHVDRNTELMVMDAQRLLPCPKTD